MSQAPLRGVFSRAVGRSPVLLLMMMVVVLLRFIPVDNVSGQAGLQPEQKPEPTPPAQPMQLLHLFSYGYGGMGASSTA